MSQNLPCEPADNAFRSDWPIHKSMSSRTPFGNGNVHIDLVQGSRKAAYVFSGEEDGSAGLNEHASCCDRAALATFVG